MSKQKFNELFDAKRETLRSSIEEMMLESEAVVQVTVDAWNENPSSDAITIELLTPISVDVLHTPDIVSKTALQRALDERNTFVLLTVNGKQNVVPKTLADQLMKLVQQ